MPVRCTKGCAVLLQFTRHRRAPTEVSISICCHGYCYTEVRAEVRMAMPDSMQKTTPLNVRTTMDPALESIFWGILTVG